MCFSFKKKVMMLLLSMLILIAMTPMMSFAADGNPATIDDLNAAISNISSSTEKSGTITLGASITGKVVIPAGDDITLDLNGYVLKASTGNYAIDNSGTLTINDSSTAKGGEVICNEAGHSAIQNDPGAVLTLNGGKYTKDLNVNNSDYYVIINHGTATINKNVKLSSTSVNSSAVENGWYDGKKGTTDPTMTVNGGEFTGGLNTFKNDDRGTLIINDGTFTNTAQVVLLSWNNTTINGGTFTPSNPAFAAISTGYIDTGMDSGITNISGGTFNSSLMRNKSDGDSTKVKYSISGGTFSIEPDTSFIASGFAKSQSDLKWIVSPATNTTTTTGTSGNTEVKTTTKADVAVDSSGTATVTIPTSELDKIVDDTANAEKAAKNAGKAVDTSIVIDGTSSAADIATKTDVEIPAGEVSKIASDTNATVTVKTKLAEVTFDQKTLDKVAETAGTSGTIKLGLKTVAAKTLSADTQKAIGPNAVIVDFSINTDKGKVSDFTGGTVTVSMTAPNGATDDNTCFVYVKDDGTYEIMPAKIVNGKIIATLSHFSHYAIADKSRVKAAIAKASANKAVKNAKVKLKAKVSKGKVKFKWSTKGTALAGYQIYRSTKSTKGFKCIKTLKSKTYTLKKGLKKGKKYYFKVRGYKIIDKVKVYTSYTTIKIKAK